MSVIWSFALVTLAAVLGTLFGGATYLIDEANAAETETVVNTALQTGKIRRETARRIYLLEERAWTDGTRVRVYRMPDGATHSAFVRDVLGMSKQEFDARWDKLVNAGLAPNIGVANGEGEMLAKIGGKGNAVGYLSKDYIVLNARGHDVQIIKIVD